MGILRANPGESSSFCSLGFFDCFSSATSTGSFSRGSPRHGFEREIGVTHQQPHLIEPMKLTVWDAIPITPSPPPPSHVSQWVSQNRNLASRTSVSIRRKSMFWSRAPTKTPFIPKDGGAPLPRPSQDYEPLNLNIYDLYRLSMLPGFDDLSFTEDGEIKAPQRALLRTKSVEQVHNSRQSFSRPRKPISLFENSRASQVRHDQLSRSNSRGRPSSEYHALSTTPPPEIPHFDNATYVATLMQKDVTPPDSALLDEMVLEFPDIEVLSQMAYDSIAPDPEPAAPYPKVPAASSEYLVPDLCADAPSMAANERTSEQISQWLGGRSHSSSFSTIKSFSTTSSFAEHRRKRFQFYQVGAAPAPPPVPLNLFRPISHHHQRSMTVSTVASTIETDVMSVDYGNRSLTSMTTASELQSRTGTVRSGVGVTSYGSGIKSSTALNPIASGIPDLPPGYNEMVNSEKADNDMVMIKEIAWPLRSPAVGMAF